MRFDVAILNASPQPHDILPYNKIFARCHPERSASKYSPSSVLFCAEPKDPEALSFTIQPQGILTKISWSKLPEDASLPLVFWGSLDSPSLLRRSSSLRMTAPIADRKKFQIQRNKLQES